MMVIGWHRNVFTFFYNEASIAEMYYYKLLAQTNLYNIFPKSRNYLTAKVSSRKSEVAIKSFTRLGRVFRVKERVLVAKT